MATGTENNMESTESSKTMNVNNGTESIAVEQ
jgi:hypothetical protein